MKKSILILFLCFCALGLFVGCTNNKHSQPVQETKTQQTSQPKQTTTQTKKVSQINPRLQKASIKFANGLNSTLNSGYSLVNVNNVYFVKSNEFEKVYFVGTVVKNNGQFYNAIWITNDMEFFGAGLVYSVNDYAKISSGMGYAKDNGVDIDSHVDGYSIVNQQLLNDMEQAIK